MRLSEERLLDIANEIVERLLDDGLIEVAGDERKLAQKLMGLFTRDLRIETEIHSEAVAWLRQHKKQFLEGTSDWEIALDRKRHDLAVARGYVLP
jgi:hypothetical protein